MNILKPTEIIIREWQNIRTSLEKCGDIGELNSRYRLNREIQGITGNLRLIRNAIEMENKYATYGYFSHEASYVFTTLATRAGKSLGLRKDLSQSFGSGYSTVRTGWLELYITEKHISEGKFIVKQWLFIKFFSPIGVDFNWDFNSPVVKKKLKLIFDKFVTWQDDSSSFFEDIKGHKTKLEAFWRSLCLVLSSPEELLEIISKNSERLKLLLTKQLD